MAGMEKLSSNLENRIVRYDEAVDPEQLTAHPLNFRRHPIVQRKALRASIEGHGWVAPVIATVDGTVIDGHARVEEALSGGVTVPVVFVDMDDDEAGSMILRMDPIAAMASHDSDVLGELLAREEWVPDELALSDRLSELIENAGPPKLQDILDGFGLVPDGEESPFTSMSFVLSTDQAETVKRAIEQAKGSGLASDLLNTNQNGNAMFGICAAFLGGHSG